MGLKEISTGEYSIAWNGGPPFITHWDQWIIHGLVQSTHSKARALVVKKYCPCLTSKASLRLIPTGLFGTDLFDLSLCLPLEPCVQPINHLIIHTPPCSFLCIYTLLFFLSGFAWTNTLSLYLYLFPIKRELCGSETWKGNVWHTCEPVSINLHIALIRHAWSSSAAQHSSH